MPIKRKPLPGDPYCPLFESDYEGVVLKAPLTIKYVLDVLECGGFQIVASDNIGYDCFWSTKLKAWCYAAE